MHQNSSLTRKDAALILIICFVYAAAAFTNLGSFRIPETGHVLEEGGEDVILQFDQPEDLAYFMCYAGYGEGSFALYASEDGENWHDLWLTAQFGTIANVSQEEREQSVRLRGVVQRYGDMYQWLRRELNDSALYVAVSPQAGRVNLLELAFVNADGNIIEPSQVVTSDGAAVSELTDETALVPSAPTYMSDFYFDEIYHVRTAYEHLHGISPYEITHPPLGKILIALGITLFGMNPFGWRFFGTLAGVLMLPVLYVLAKMLFRRTRYAAMAAILFAADFMHYTQTRIGTVDSFSVLWILIMYLFMYRFACMDFLREPLKKTLVPLFLSGLFFGIGAATKWICLYAGIGLLIVWILVLRRIRKEYAGEKKKHPEDAFVLAFSAKFRKMVLCTLVFFLAVPAAIYLLSYLPYTLVTDGGAYSFADILENQHFMLTYHGNLIADNPHPYASMWYTWPLDIRPVLFYAAHSDALGLSTVFCTFGNPLVWWGASAGALCLIPLCIRRRQERSFGLLFVAIAALCQYAPWWFISRELFIYHFFSVVPFLILLLIFWIRYLESRFSGARFLSVCYVAACCAAFAFFYPVLTGTPVPTAYVKALAWLPTWPF